MTPEPTPQSNGKPADHNQPANILDLAGDDLRVGRALQWQAIQGNSKYLDSLRDAETKAAYGDKFNAPNGDDMIAVDSQFKTEHHYHHPAPPAQPQPKPMPAWAKVALIVAALAGTGGAGALIANAIKPSEGAATSQPGAAKEWELDFWSPDDGSKS